MDEVSPTLGGRMQDLNRWGRRLAAFPGVIALAVVVVMTPQAGFIPAHVSAGTSGQSVGTDKPTGELRIAMAGIGVMRPIPWQEPPFSKGYRTLLYDFLVGANADGTLSTANGAAEKWEMSPDGLTWTFTLRKGITFHDGSELTA